MGSFVPATHVLGETESLGFMDVVLVGCGGFVCRISAKSLQAFVLTCPLQSLTGSSWPTAAVRECHLYLHGGPQSAITIAKNETVAESEDADLTSMMIGAVRMCGAGEGMS